MVLERTKASRTSMSKLVIVVVEFKYWLSEADSCILYCERKMLLSLIDGQ